MALRPISDALPQSGAGKSPKTQIFTVTGTWVNPGVDLVFVRGIAGGGGGGGAQTYDTSTQANAGGGGGAGQYCDWEPLIVVGDQLVTIGAGGLGGTGGIPPTGNVMLGQAEAGANGGDTLFGALLTLKGGQGGEGRDSEGARLPAAVDCGSQGGPSALTNTGILPIASHGGGIVDAGLSPYNVNPTIVNPGYNFYGLPPLLWSVGICDRGWPGAGGRATVFDVKIGYGGRSGVVDTKTAADGGDAQGVGCVGGGGICYDNNTVVGNGGNGSSGWLEVLWYE